MIGARPKEQVDEDLLAASLCMRALADRIVQHGPSDQVLANLERATDGFRRLMVERRALGGGQ
ncbi:MAG: hypothetical protein ACTHNM_06800 [Dyella sp.]|uniref:hypothetical protein n=1 Tax=Dyella sp. TaxID=1869338 RepID=UPI003F7DD8C4